MEGLKLGWMESGKTLRRVDWMAKTGLANGAASRFE